MDEALWNKLSDDLRAKILRMDESGICATDTEIHASCIKFWSDTIADERHYWEKTYPQQNNGQVVPPDKDRQDIPVGKPRPSGFDRILDLIRRRDGVELKADKLPQHVTMKKAYTSLLRARTWAPHHWHPNRKAFENLEELQAAYATLATNDENRRAVIQRYGEPEAWIVTPLSKLSQLARIEHNTFTEAGNDFSEFSSVFNEPIGAWDTSNVIEMNMTFFNCISFNQYIGAWNTSKVEQMNGTFQYAEGFNQPIGDWNTSNVKSMKQMFHFAQAFNQPIGEWKTPKVENMVDMFAEAKNFNQPIGDWNTAEVTRMERMFYWAEAFNQPINDWKTGKVEDMSGMFYHATAFNQPIKDWKTGEVGDMSRMFAFATAFNQPIGKWDTSKVRYMRTMFYHAWKFNQPLDWNTSGVETMEEMFAYAKGFNQPIHSWDTSNVTSMKKMFFEAESFNQPIEKWNFSSVKWIKDMINGSQIHPWIFRDWCRNMPSLNEESRHYVRSALLTIPPPTVASASASVVDAVFAFHRIRV